MISSRVMKIIGVGAIGVVLGALRWIAYVRRKRRAIELEQGAAETHLDEAREARTYPPSPIVTVMWIIVIEVGFLAIMAAIAFN